MRHIPTLCSLALFCIAAFGPAAVLADPPAHLPGRLLTAGEFDAYATGQTLSYAAGGQVWGSEQYLPDRQVMWAFTGQECKFGQWYAQGNAVCFVYEGDPDPKCWTFYMGPRGLIAELLGNDGFTPCPRSGKSSQPLECQGPQVGV